MRRVLLLLLVAAVLASGCARSTRSAGASQASIAIGDGLTDRGRYAEATDAYIVAAYETTAGALHDEALRKAAVALGSDVATRPLPVQVAAMKRLLARTREFFLPLYAHNWMCERLSANARLAVSHARTAAAANAEAIAANAHVEQDTPAEGGSRHTTAPVDAGRSPGATASVVATLTRTSSVAARRTLAMESTAAVPGMRLCSAAEYRLVAHDVLALGQPPSVQKLYDALAELRSAMDAAFRARRSGQPLTREQLRMLREADARLQRAMAEVEALRGSV